MQSEDLHRVIELATLAPSLHNSQPWRFVADGDVIDVYADRGRLVKVIDPTGRQLAVSCGGALLLARLGVRAQGRHCALELLPDPSNEDHLARLTVGGAEPATSDEQALVAAASVRHSHRGAFDPRPLPAGLVDALRAAAAAEDGWLHVVARREDLVALAVLLERAEQTEQHDPAYVEELRRWVRDAATSEDGLPASVVDAGAAGERATPVSLRDFAPQDEDAADRAPASDGPPPEVERPLIVVLGTDRDDPQSWLVAGMAMLRVLLRAAVDGVQASLLGPVIDLPSTRALLRSELGLVGHPQMLLRMGYAGEIAGTGRRPVAAVLTEGSG